MRPALLHLPICIEHPWAEGLCSLGQDCPNFANSTIIAYGAQQACFADLFNGCGTGKHAMQCAASQVLI